MLSPPKNASTSLLKCRPLVDCEMITLQNIQSSKLLKSQKQQMRQIDAKCIPFDTSTSLIFPILSPEKSQIT